MTPRIASRETGNYPPVLVAIVFPAIAIGLAFPVFDPQKIKGVINSKSKKSQLPDSVVAKSPLHSLTAVVSSQDLKFFEQ